jgi:UDP-N-acetylglucosamine 2-epimerase (non-hydrolysing)
LAETDHPPAPLHIACVLGTRPEAIKLAPIVLAARSTPGSFVVTTIATGQHREMADAALAAFGLTANVDLKVMEANQRPTDVIARVMLTLPTVLDTIRPDVVLVQGDTASTLSGALCAYHAKIPVGHVEAGLRTADRYSPFPEEMNRRLTSAIATFHFAPTTSARARLLAEHIDPETVVVTGNTVIDALHHLRSAMRQPAGITLPPRSRLILLTCHRRENHGDKLGEICAAVRDIVAARPEVILVCPVHPHPDVASRMRSELGGVRGIQLLEPLDYPELLWLMEASTLVLTDSGGLQEEAPTFKRPVLVLRDVTERPEGVESGVARLLGTDRTTIVRETLRLLDDPNEYSRMAMGGNPYGDGHAAARILGWLQQHVPVSRGAAAALASS